MSELTDFITGIMTASDYDTRTFFFKKMTVTLDAFSGDFYVPVPMTAVGNKRTSDLNLGDNYILADENIIFRKELQKELQLNGNPCGKYLLKLVHED